MKVTNLISVEDISNINKDIKPYMDADYNSGLEVFAKQTKTVCGLAGKSPSAVKAILQNSTVKQIVNDALTDVYDSWWGDARNKCTSPPLLSSFFTVRVGPGSARQGLHRDDQVSVCTQLTTSVGLFPCTRSVKWHQCHQSLHC